MRNVHYSVAHAEEVLAHERLGKEISNVFGRGNKGDTKSTVLHALADEVMPAIDVLRPCVVLGIISQIDGRSIVHLERRRFGHVESELA